MEYIEFKEKLIAELERQYTEGSVKYQEQIKLNGVKLDGVALISKDNNISPVFYIESFYDEDYLEKDIEVLAKELIRRREKEGFTEDMVPTFNVEEFKNFNCIKNKIMPVLVNTALNDSLLEQLPHREWLDLSIIYHVTYNGASIRLYNSHMDIWGITEEELYKQAMDNLRQVQKDIKAMDDMLNDLFARGGEPLFSEEDMANMLNTQDGTPRMIVVSNIYRVYGASVCLLDEVMNIISEKLQSDKFYIAMSSVHECIVFNSNEIESDYLKEMIPAINKESVESQEILSDNVYLYESGEIRIV